MTARQQRIGIIGTGNMGGRIARRVVEHGTDVLAYDADLERARRAGTATAASVGDLAGRCDVVLLSLPDSSVVEAVCRRPGGLLQRVGAGQVIVDLSTANPASTMALHADFGRLGVEYLDAAISGGAAGAEQGTLTIMVGGSAQALEQVRWVLGFFSQHVYHMGGSGAGHTTKILNNFLNGVSLAATAEVMVAARKAGLDLERVLDVLNHSSGVNFATLNRFPHIIRGDYLEGGLTGTLMEKDLRLYTRLTDDLDVASFIGPPCLMTFHVSNALGYAEVISNRVVDALGDLSGGVEVAAQEATQGGIR